jgi:hypothetical protein
MSPFMPRPAWTKSSYLCFSVWLGCQVCTTLPRYWLRWGSHKLFAWAGLCDPPDLHLPSSSDYGLEPPLSASLGVWREKEHLIAVWDYPSTGPLNCILIASMSLPYHLSHKLCFAAHLVHVCVQRFKPRAPILWTVLCCTFSLRLRPWSRCPLVVLLPMGCLPSPSRVNLQASFLTSPNSHAF